MFTDRAFAGLETRCVGPAVHKVLQPLLDKRSDHAQTWPSVSDITDMLE